MDGIVTGNLSRDGFSVGSLIGRRLDVFLSGVACSVRREVRFMAIVKQLRFAATCECGGCLIPVCKIF